MNRPKRDEKRPAFYLVTSHNYVAGRYIGETDERVVLDIGTGVRGFTWSEVEPVEMRETHE